MAGVEIPSLNVLGVTVLGIHPRLIENAHLQLKIPLTGNGRIAMGQNKKAHLDIKKGTIASVDMKLGKNAQGQLAVTHFSLVFNKSIKIYNPTASLVENPSVGRFTRRLLHGLSVEVKDRLTDLWLKKVVINADGHTDVEAKIKLAYLLKQKIHPEIEPVPMPVIDEEFLAKIGLIRPVAGEAKKNPSNPTDMLKKLDLTNLLPKLGAASRQGTYSLEISGKNAATTLSKDGYQITGAREPLKVSLSGTVDVARSGNIEIAVDEQNSRILSSFGDLCAGGKLKVDNLATAQPIRVEIKGNISTVDSFSPLGTANNIMPAKDSEQVDASFGAEQVTVALNGHASAIFTRTGEMMLSTAKGMAMVGAKNPFAKLNDRGIELDGELVVTGCVDKAEFVAGMDSPNGNGQVKVCFTPSPNLRAKFPGLQTMEQVYGIEVHRDGKARITPPEHGITNFLHPVKNLQGFDERVNTVLTRTSLHPIGTAEYFDRVTEITGYPVTTVSSLKVLIDGVNSMPERLRMINGAKEVICCQTLAFKSDESGWAYANALVDAAKRGVKVYAIVDSLGNISSIDELQKPNELYQFMRENGVRLHVFNSFVEDGLREIFSLVNQCPAVFQCRNPKSMKNVYELLNFFDRVIQVAQDQSFNKLPRQQKIELQKSLHKLFGGLPGSNVQPSINEMKNALRRDLVPLESVLVAVRRMGDMSHRWHEKYLVVDGQEAIMGGMNIADEYLKGGSGAEVVIDGKRQLAWRDTDVCFTGPAVAEAYENFRRNWLYAEHEELGEIPTPQSAHQEEYSGIPVSILQHRPMIDGDHHVTNFLLYNLRTLKPGEKAWFETAYFLPRGVLRALQKELVACAKRGVDVRILTNSKSTSDSEMLVEASIFDERELLEAGARIFHRKEGRMVHAKVMVLGDQLSMVGSWNMDNRSAAHDSEGKIVVWDEGVNRELTDALNRDMFLQSDEVTMKTIGSRPLKEELRSAAYLMAGELL